AISILAFDLAPHDFFIAGSWCNPTALAQTSTEWTVAVAACLMGILGGRFGTGASADENPFVPVRRPRQHHDLVVIQSRTGPAAVCRDECGCLAPKTKQNTMIVTSQVLARSFVATRLHH